MKSRLSIRLHRYDQDEDLPVHSPFLNVLRQARHNHNPSEMSCLAVGGEEI